MRPSKAHFVTSCQQVLALGVVLAVLTPAASVVSLDVVHQAPGSSSRAHETPAARLSAYAREAVAPSRVPSAPVDAEVTEVALTPPSGPAGRRMAVDARTQAAPGEATAVVSRPQAVTGYSGVGVTWDPRSEATDEELSFEVRTRDADAWSDWTPLEYHDEHAPDPDSPEGRQARPGTDVMFVGHVDDVQLRATSEDAAAPADMRLAVVEPGEAPATARELPALGETEIEPNTARAMVDGSSAARVAPAAKPRIYSRAQWGADEALRDGRPSYGTVSAGFVHHTVNANDYAKAEVPGILRSIYAYHTRSRGWSDVGYNFLVDKFGRIWEGRAGGVGRPVVGAHTYGYNSDSFAMSAIGNFDTVRPPEAMLRAYGNLFAWKLGLHGVDPLDTSQNVSGSILEAVNGHRDAGSTACPGRYLYARLPDIRRYAADASEPEAPEPEPVVLQQVDSDLAGTAYPDLVVRRGSDGRGMILPTGGLNRFRSPVVLARTGWGSRRFLTTPDVTGDDRVDLLTFDASGSLEVRPGLPTGGFGPVTRTSPGFRGHQLLASVGDVTGDGRADLVARSRRHLVTFVQTRRGRFRPVSQSTVLRGHRQLVGAGDVTADGKPDLWARSRRGSLFLHRGLGEGRFGARVAVAGDWSGYDGFVGGADYTGDAVPDLVARRTDGSLMLMPSRGGGTLGRAIGPMRGPDELSMVSGAGQLAGDASPDLVAARADGALVVLAHRGTFDLGRPIDTGQSFARSNLLLNAGDFTGDGHGDVLLRRRNGSLWLHPGNGTGKLGAGVRIGGRGFEDVSGLRVVEDLTADDRYDLVGRLATKETVVWPGRGAAPLADHLAVQVAPEQRGEADVAGYDWVVPVSDLKGRGAADLVVRDRDGLLYRLDGTGRGWAAAWYLGEAGGYDLVG